MNENLIWQDPDNHTKNLYNRAKKYSFSRFVFGVKCWCAYEELLHVTDCDLLYDDTFAEPLIIGYRK